MAAVAFGPIEDAVRRDMFVRIVKHYITTASKGPKLDAVVRGALHALGSDTGRACCLTLVRGVVESVTACASEERRWIEWLEAVRRADAAAAVASFEYVAAKVSAREILTEARRLHAAGDAAAAAAVLRTAQSAADAENMAFDVMDATRVMCRAYVHVTLWRVDPEDHVVYTQPEGALRLTTPAYAAVDDAASKTFDMVTAIADALHARMMLDVSAWVGLGLLREPGVSVVDYEMVNTYITLEEEEEEEEESDSKSDSDSEASDPDSEMQPAT